MPQGTLDSCSPILTLGSSHLEWGEGQRKVTPSLCDSLGEAPVANTFEGVCPAHKDPPSYAAYRRLSPSALLATSAHCSRPCPQPPATRPPWTPVFGERPGPPAGLWGRSTGFRSLCVGVLEKGDVNSKATGSPVCQLHRLRAESASFPVRSGSATCEGAAAPPRASLLPGSGLVRRLSWRRDFKHGGTSL